MHCLRVVWLSLAPAAAVLAAGGSGNRIPLSGWRPHPDGGRAPAMELAASPGGGSVLRLRYRDVPPHWGNLRHAVTVPAEASGIAVRLRVVSAAPGAAFHFWLFEKDGDGYVARVRPGGMELDEAGHGWHDVFVPFTEFRYEPRGDGRRHFLSIDRMLLGCNYADMTLELADLRFAGTRVRGLPLPRTGGLRYSRGVRGAVGILREPGFSRGPAQPAPEHLGRLLAAAGYGVTYLRAGDVCDPGVLTPGHFDVLVIPCAPLYPSAGRAALIRYLRGGGAFFSIGGYAFDDLRVYTEKGWRRREPTVTAAEMDRNREGSGRINTRYGVPGDTVRFSPEQIGVFDPSFKLERAVRIAACPGQFILPENWAKPLRPRGFAAVALLGSDDPVFPRAYARRVPVLRAVDRFGRDRGPVLSLVYHYAGPYAGSRWAFTGVTNLNLFGGDFPALDRAFVSIVERLRAPVFLSGLQTDLACYEPGETVHLRVRVHGEAAPGAGLRVRFEIGEVWRAESAVEEGRDRVVAGAWRPREFARDFYPVRCLLFQDRRVIDEVRTGFSVRSKRILENGPRIQLQRNYFTLNGIPTFLSGTNQTGTMWFSAFENPLVWERDFRRMRDYGINLLRILHFSPFVRSRNIGQWPHHAAELAGTAPEAIRRKTDAIIQTAQKHNVGIFLTLHDWLPVALTDAELAAERKWDRFWTARYRDVPGMLYDIQNEPGVRIPDRPDIRALLRRWLAQQYGSVDSALEQWKASGAGGGLDLHAKARGWEDLRARDLDRFRAFLFNRWTAANAEAIHAGDPAAPATVGFLQTPTAADKPLGIRNLDFANTHYYGALPGFRATLKLIDSRWAGKSFSLGEFGARRAHEARAHGADGDPAAVSVHWFLAVGHYALGMGASFVANWDWKEMPDCVFPWGINYSNMTPKPVLEAYRNMSLLFRAVQPRYRAPRLYLVLPDGSRFGWGAGEFWKGLSRAANWLLDTNTAFGVIPETALSSLPPGVRALVWPLAYSLSDGTVGWARKFVDSGGAILFTGDFRFSEARRPERLQRPGMFGLIPPEFSPQPPFSAAAGRVPAGPFEGHLGKGWVLWAPRPPEFSGDRAGRRLYADFVERTGLRRFSVTPGGEAGVHGFEGDCVEGRYFVFYNGGSRAAEVRVQSKAKVPELRLDLAPGGPGFVLLGRQNRVLAAEAEGRVVVGGKDVVDFEGHAALVSLDGLGLGDSRELVFLPFGPGPASAVVHGRMRGDAGARRVEIGEFHDGVWRKLAPDQAATKTAAGHGWKVESGADTPFDLRLIAVPERLAHARRAMADLLAHRP